MLPNVSEEEAGRHRLELMPVEPALQPLIEALTADGDLDRPQESGTLLIGDVVEATVRVPALQVDVQPGVGIGRPAVVSNRLVHRIEPKRDLLRGYLWPIDGFDNPALG